MSSCETSFEKWMLKHFSMTFSVGSFFLETEHSYLGTQECIKCNNHMRISTLRCSVCCFFTRIVYIFLSNHNKSVNTTPALKNCQIQVSMHGKILQEPGHLNKWGLQCWICLFTIQCMMLKQLHYKFTLNYHVKLTGKDGLKISWLMSCST